MGSIQSLRSWALATRANEDTDVQVSGFLGSVNKSLGKQIVDIIDQLQGIIGERTKAYNDLVASINKTIDGRDGVGSKGILAAMSGIKVVGAFVSAITSPAAAGPATALTIFGSIVSNFLSSEGIKASVASAVYDYERMASQLGYATIRGTALDGQPPANLNGAGLTTGASKFVDSRDALMPRYNKSKSATGYIAYPYQGYVGTLRRM